MFFLRNSYCSDIDTALPTPTNVKDINVVVIRNGIFDELHITRETTSGFTDEITQNWSFDTILHALFNGNLQAGNVDFTAQEVTSIRIKRRKKGTYDWTVLYEIPIHTSEDFKFERLDRYARSQTEYEYALVPVTGNIEGNYNTNSVLSQFDGIFILDREQAFQTLINTSIEVQQNRPSSVISTLGRRYPYVVSVGESNYSSGNVSGTFIKLNEDTCQFDFENGWKYRQELMDFLGDGSPKCIKTDNGRMWLACVVDYPSENAQLHEEMPITAFSFAEVGNADSGRDLYDNGFIDALNGR